MALATLDTYEDIITHLTSSILADASYDSYYLLALCSTADHLIAMEHPFSFLRKVDSSNTRTTDATYATTYALPTDYLYTRKVNVGEDENVYTGANMEDFKTRKEESQLYFIDFENSQLRLSGTEGSAKTIYHHYIKSPAMATSGGTPPWPQGFRLVTAYAVADMLAGADADQVSMAKVPHFSRKTRQLIDAMALLDGQRVRASMGGSYWGPRNRDYSKNANVITEEV